MRTIETHASKDTLENDGRDKPPVPEGDSLDQMLEGVRARRGLDKIDKLDLSSLKLNKNQIGRASEEERGNKAARGLPGKRIRIPPARKRYASKIVFC